MKKILITGSTGMLGSDLVKGFLALEQYEVYGLGRSVSPLMPLANQFVTDLALPFDTAIIDITPDVIIHTAALTDLNVCEQNPALADQIHSVASRSLAKLSGKNTLFIYISSDSIFNGEKGMYSETDAPDPLNVYALSKLKGEHAVLHENKGLTTIIRTNIYGFHLPMKNSLAEWAYREWAAGKKIYGFTDIIFNAVFTSQLVAIIHFLIDHHAVFPVLNVGSDTAISKYDFLEKFGQALRIDSNLLKPALSSDVPSTIARPKNTSLDTSLLSSFYRVPDFASGIQQWLEQAVITAVCKPPSQ
jgi:dTDP-4-dehydrorhamnose reductase